MDRRMIPARRASAVGAMLVAAVLTVVGCGGGTPVGNARVGDVRVTNATARATADDVSVLYLTIGNAGKETDALLSVSTDAAKSAQLMAMVMEGMSMKMQDVARVEVPAGGEVVLKPGGYHVMLMGVARPLKAGQRIGVTLKFERAGTVRLQVPVTSYSGGQ